MFYVHLDVLATCILPGQIIDNTRVLTETAPIKHSKNHIETVMKPSKTRDSTANLGRRLTKDTTNRGI